MLSIIPGNAKIPFMSYRKVAFAASAVVIVVGLGMFGVRGMDNFGVDFQQGTNLMLHIENSAAVPVSEVRAALTSAGFNNPVVQETGADETGQQNTFIVRVGDVTRRAAETVEGAAPGGDETMLTVAQMIQGALAPLSAGGDASGIVVEDEQTVGPAVGAQLRLDALNALFWAMVFIMAYLWIRFELRFAAGAVIALVHDILVAVGLFSLLGGQVSMQMIAALLTIVGYSLNDTIVVFDRVREDMQLNRGKGVKFVEILNNAISATLSRTLLTSLTTLFVVVVLYLFGGEAINDFALVLIIGVLVGTYSSIFVASPVAYLLQKRKADDALQRPSKKTKADDADEKGKEVKERRPRKSGAKA